MNRRIPLTRFSFYLFMALVLCASVGCSENRPDDIKAAEKTVPPQNLDSLMKAAFKDSILNLRPEHGIKYKAFISRGRKTLSRLEKRYGKEVRRIVLALNRIDDSHLRYGDTLVVPDKIYNFLSYSPFPLVIDELSEIPKMILVSKRLQAFAAYQNGIIVRWGPTSTGTRKKPTPTGLFFMNWKAKKTISTIDPEWILPYYFNFENREGVALHEFDMPGYPASHACVRLLKDDAVWFYRWAEQWIVSANEDSVEAFGTPILVFDKYPFGKRRPWRALLNNPSSAMYTNDQVLHFLGKHLDIISQKVAARRQVIEARERIKMARKDSSATVVPR